MDRNEAIKVIKHNWPEGRYQLSEALKTLIPELNESKDERIRKNCIHFLELQKSHHAATFEIDECIAWLEKKGEPRVDMVQWKGDNLMEVLEFTGKNKNFDKWFASFEEFEKYVHEHNDIFKIFNEDGSHYEVPVGAWIVKTPDGYNVPSKAKYKQKIEQNLTWSEKDEDVFNDIIIYLNNNFKYGMIKWLKSFKEKTKGE